MKHLFQVRLFAAIVSVFMVGALAQASILQVNKSGDGTTVYNDFSTALAAAGTGDTIQFTDTTAVEYDESAATVVWPSVDGNAIDNLTVTATTPGVVTIKGRQDITGHSHPTIKNVILSTGAVAADAVIYQADSFGTFENCTFKFAAGAAGNAHLLFVLNGSVTATGCTFQDTPNEQCSAFFGDYTATLNATDCHFNNLAGFVFRSGGGGYNVNLTHCDSAAIAARVTFFVYDGTINITRSDLTVGQKLIEVQPFDPRTVTVNVKRSKITGSEIAINGSDSATLDATFENCIFKGFWVPLYANNHTATSNPNVLRAYYCLFLDSTGGVTFGDGNDKIIVKNSIITAASLGFIKTANMTLEEDYNAVMMPGGYLAGANDVDGRDAGFAPLFVNAATGDYHLQELSPLLGKGVVIAGIDTDFDGNVRRNPVGSLPDIGPFESYLVPVELATFSAE